jgi:serine protease Do
MGLSSCAALEIIGSRFGDGWQETTVQRPPIGNGDTINNDITINTDGTDLAAAANFGLRSIVSVYCTFSGILGNSGGSAGSGVIYKLDENGNAFVITNYHVVAKNGTSNVISNKINLYLFGMEATEYGIPATYVGGSMNYDIAVLRVENSAVLKEAIAAGSVAAATLANSDKIAAGQSTIAIGNPEASGISVTTGIVSVDSEYIDMTGSDDVTPVSFRVIRTDTAVNSGNSGGGLFNGKGELIGIVNAKISSTDVENIGYAIPSNVARAIADNIIDFCYGKDCKTVMRGLLGITVTTNALSTKYNTETGVLERYEEIIVHEVNKGGLGETILKAGDILKTITLGERKVEITRQYHLIDAMLDVRVGDTVYMEILRNGEEITVSTVITEDCLVAY